EKNFPTPKGLGTPGRPLTGRCAFPYRAPATDGRRATILSYPSGMLETKGVGVNTTQNEGPAGGTVGEVDGPTDGPAGMAAPVNLSVVLDRSGSMHRIAADMIGGFQQFIDEQKQTEGEVRISLVQFDSDDPFEVLI